MHVMTSKVCETGESSDCSAVPECLAFKVQVVLSSENHLILPLLPMLYRYELCVLLETKFFKEHQVSDKLGNGIANLESRILALSSHSVRLSIVHPSSQS